VSGGIGGGLLIVVGAALLVSADLRDEWHKLDRIERLLRDGAAVADEPEPARAETGSNGSNGTDRAVTPLRRRTPDDRLRATGS
jgi:hypothetical protein